MTVPIKIIRKEDYLKENIKPIQEEVWDSIAEPWKKYVVKRIPIVVDFLKDKSGNVIDLGCGTGRNMVPSENIKYFGIDFSQNQIDCAKRVVEKEGIYAELIKGGADNLDFDDEFFDAGLFIASLHCIEGVDERLLALKEFYRVLKKGSEGLISVWDSSDKRFYDIKGDVYLSWKEDGKENMRYYYLYSRDEFFDLLKSVGFDILEIYGVVEGDRFSKKNLIVRVKK